MNGFEQRESQTERVQLSKEVGELIRDLHRAHDESRAQGPDALRTKQRRLMLALVRRLHSQLRVCLGADFLSMQSEYFRAPMPKEVATA